MDDFSNVTERNATLNLTPREVHILTAALVYFNTNSVLLENTHEVVPLVDLTVRRRRLPFPSQGELAEMIKRFRTIGRPRSAE